MTQLPTSASGLFPMMAIPQSSRVALNMKNEDFKCRKCRHGLFDTDVVVDAHRNPLILGRDADRASCCEFNRTVWYLNEEVLPEWTRELVDEANWIKGKLFCPKCKGRLGSFDFVNCVKCICGNSVLPCIHVVKAKVDCNIVGVTSFMASSLPSSIHCPPSPSTSQTLESEENKNLSDTPSNLSPKENVSPDLTQESDSEESFREPNFEYFENNPFNNEKEGVRARIRIAKFFARKEVWDEYIQRKLRTDITEEQKRNLTFPTDKNLETEQIEKENERLLCAVCLDLYYNPFYCRPCNHIFCEPCLKKLVLINSEAIPCPLCRQTVSKSERNRELMRELSVAFPQHYFARQDNEAETLKNRALLMPGEQPRYMSYANMIRGHIESYPLTTPIQDDQALWEVLLVYLPTITLVMALFLVSVLTFILSYLGCKYLMEFAAWYFQSDFDPMTPAVVRSALAIIAVLVYCLYRRLYAR